jgi:hypothetical protein
MVSLNMWFKRHGLCKSMIYIYIYGHMKVQEEKEKKGHLKVPRYWKKERDKHMKAHIYKK